MPAAEGIRSHQGRAKVAMASSSYSSAAAPHTRPTKRAATSYYENQPDLAVSDVWGGLGCGGVGGMFYVTCYSVQDVLAKMLKVEEEDREKEYEKNREAKERTKMDEEDKEGQKRRME